MLTCLLFVLFSCKQCIEAAKIVDDKRHLRIVAIAEKRDEHA